MSRCAVPQNQLALDNFRRFSSLLKTMPFFEACSAWPFVILIIVGSQLLFSSSARAFPPGSITIHLKPYWTTDIKFKTHDGHDMLGRLASPFAPATAVVIDVQSPQGMTLDLRRINSQGEPVNYFDMYRIHLCKGGVAFFSYEGRGVRGTDKRPYFLEIDRKIYDTSSLENKVRDGLQAIEAVRRQPGLKSAKLFLMGNSEASLVATEIASRCPDQVSGLILGSVLAVPFKEKMISAHTDGVYLPFGRYMDKDGDGKVTPREFEENFSHPAIRDLYGYYPKFGNFDMNKDGVITVDDFKIKYERVLEAVKNEDFDFLSKRIQASEIETPANWHKDHFRHEPIWTFLSKLTIPVGIFHGTLDELCPVQGVQDLEAKVRRAKLTNIKFHYFKDADHFLGSDEFMNHNKLSKPYQSMIDFTVRLAEK